MIVYCFEFDKFCPKEEIFFRVVDQFYCLVTNFIFFFFLKKKGALLVQKLIDCFNSYAKSYSSSKFKNVLFI